jgi:hypothetical protein
MGVTHPYRSTAQDCFKMILIPIEKSPTNAFIQNTWQRYVSLHYMATPTELIACVSNMSGHALTAWMRLSICEPASWFTSYYQYPIVISGAAKSA